MQDIISTLKNALQQAEAGLEVAVGRLAKDGTERGDFKTSEVLALAIVREALSVPVPCLHQIQEPEDDIWPCLNIDVDESGNITNAKLYSPGLPAGNHDVYPVRVPYMDEHTEAWRACVDELEKHVPGFMCLSNMNGIECAVAAIRLLSERAKSQEPSAAEQATWHAGLDEGRAQAAPAAVAVADERWCPDVCPITGRRFFGWIEHWKTRQQVPTYGGPFDSYTIPVKDKDGTFSCERFDHDAGEWMTEGMGWCDLGLQLVDDQAFVVQPDNPRYDEIRDFAEGRAALATPAQSVVLPEHAAVVTFEWRKKPDVKWLIDTVVRGTKLYTEQQVRVLLARVSAPAAQAVASIYVTADGQRECDDWKMPLPIGRNLLYTAPQMPADAQDALTDSALLDAMEQKRIAVVPEYEGPWDAEIYNDDGTPNHRGSGSTPREAIRAAIAAAQQTQGGGDATD
ncbi:hypothetical protein CTYAZ2_12070 [Comamonas testosteroni]|nr:hypothetical protein CTYAZ2_12070 [Comamonas testosteroni]